MSDSVSNETVRMGFELSQFMSGTTTIAEGYKKIGLAITDLADKSVILNKKQEALQITQKATIQDNINSTITYKRYKESVEDLGNGIQKITYKYEPYRIALSGITAEMQRQQIVSRAHAEALIEDGRRVAMEKKLSQNQQYQDYAANMQKEKAISTAHSQALVEDRRRAALQIRAIAAQQAAEQARVMTNLARTAPAAGGGNSYLAGLGNQALSLATGMAIFEVFAGIQNNIRNSVTAAHDLIEAIAEIRTISQDNQMITAEWRNEIIRLSSTYGHDLKDVTEGLYQTLSNQVASGAETESFMRDAMEFAIATKSTTTQAVNLLSSGIKGFGLSVEETRPLAASFFKLIELGRVRADEMADTFGKTGPIAHQLGLSYNDLNATYAAMTIQGVKFNNAATFTRQMLLSLLKPSKDMQALFEEWNVASGEAAISTYGWIGVIEKLQKVVERGGLTELAHDFKNIRAIQGGALLSGPGFTEFKHDFTQFGGKANENYNVAVEETMKNPAREWDIEWQKVKNSFINVGETIMRTVLKMGDQFGGLFQTLHSGLVWFTTLTAGVLTLSEILGGTTIVIWALDTSVAALSGTMSLLWATMLENPYTAVLAIAAAAITYMVMTSENAEARVKRMKESTEKYAQEIKVVLGDIVNKERGELDAVLRDQFQGILQVLAGIRGSYKSVMEGVKEEMRDINNDLKAGIDAFMGSLTSNIENLKGELSILKSIIHEGEAGLKSFKEKRDGRDFEKQLSLMPDNDKAAKELEKARDLKKNISDMYQQAEIYISNNNLESAKKQYEHVNAQLEEALKMADTAETHLYKAAKDALKDQEKAGLDDETIGDTKLNYQKRITEVLKEQKTLEEIIYANRKRMVELAKQEAENREAALKYTKELQKELKQQFNDAMKAQGKKQTDEDKLKQIKDAQAAFRKATEEEPDLLSFQGALEIDTKLQEKIDLLERVAAVKGREAEMDKVRQYAEKQQAKFLENRTKLIGEQDIALRDVRNSLGSLITMAEEYGKIKWGKVEAMSPADLAEVRHQYEDIFKSKDDDTTIAERFKAADKIVELTTKAQLNSYQNPHLLRDDTFGNLVGKLEGGMLKYTETQEGIDKIKAMADKQNQKLQELKVAYNLLFGEMTKTVKDNLEEQYRDWEAMVNKVMGKLGELDGFRAQINVGKGKQENGDEPGFATGGWVGGPAGHDAVRARLTAGEYVINANAASRYREEVVAINANRGLKMSGSSGSTHNNSFGNINITIAGGQTTAASVREIGLALRREIKQGRIPALDGE